MRVTLRNPARRRGFSLIEVLVAMAILTIIVLIVAGIFQQTSLAWSLGLRRADEQSAVRAVVGALSRDLSMIVDPANFVIGPTHGNTSERDTAMEAGDLDAADGTLDGNTLDFWILRAPDLFDEDGTATRELYHVTYSGGNPVKREVKAFGAQGYDTPSDTSEEAGGGESEYDLGTGGSVRFEAISPDDDTVRDFFTLVAARMYCETGDACMRCRGCRTTLDGNNPDAFFVNPKCERLKVQDVKDLISEVSIKALSGVKTFFVMRADLMAPDAQNKLLKTLEEPPEGVVIFLGVANEAGMLDTVKSRCRKIYLDVFDRETVYEALLGAGCDAESAAVAASCSEGQLGKALGIARSPEYGAHYSDALTLLERLKKSRDILSAELVPSLKADAGEFLKVLAVVVRDVIAAKRGDPLFFGAEISSRIESIAQGFSLRALALTENAINRAQEKLSFTVNQTAVEDSLLFDILEVKHKWQS